MYIYIIYICCFLGRRVSKSKVKSRLVSSDGPHEYEYGYELYLSDAWFFYGSNTNTSRIIVILAQTVNVS